MSDVRAALAREAHRLSREADSLAARHRQRRNELILALRDDDPKQWTYVELARAIGMTPEMIAAVCQGRTSPNRKRGGATP